jgi:Sec-independent protein translocase protein TatA
MKKLALVLLLVGCPNKQEPPAPAESPKFVKQYKQQMDSAKKDVEAAQKKEEQRDDKLLEQTKQ